MFVCMIVWHVLSWVFGRFARHIYIYIYHFDEFAHLTGMALNRLHIYFDQNDSHDIKPNLLAHERPRIGVVANVYLIQFV